MSTYGGSSSQQSDGQMLETEMHIANNNMRPVNHVPQPSNSNVGGARGEIWPQEIICKRYGPRINKDIKGGGRLTSEIIDGFDEQFGKHSWYRESFFVVDCSMPKGLLGFGFLVRNCPEVDIEFEATHCLNAKQVSVYRTISVSKLPETVRKDDLVDFFSKYGKVLDGEIISRNGSDYLLGIVVFDKKESVDRVLSEPDLYFQDSKVNVRKAVVMRSWMPPPPATGWRGVKEKILSMIGSQPKCYF